MTDTMHAAEFERRWREQQPLQVLDVRSYAERRALWVEGTMHVPLDELDRPESLSKLRRIEGELCLLCKGGMRATKAQQLLHGKLDASLVVIDGGIDALAERGCTEAEPSAVWSLERQVRFTAGSLVLIACLLALLVAEPFIYVAAGVGCGLMIAALTDSCAMGLLLAKMPWNRRSA